MITATLKKPRSLTIHGHRFMLNMATPVEPDLAMVLSEDKRFEITGLREHLKAIDDAQTAQEKADLEAKGGTPTPTPTPTPAPTVAKAIATGKTAKVEPKKGGIKIAKPATAPAAPKPTHEQTPAEAPTPPLSEATPVETDPAHGAAKLADGTEDAVEV